MVCDWNGWIELSPCFDPGAAYARELGWVVVGFLEVLIAGGAVLGALLWARIVAAFYGSNGRDGDGDLGRDLSWHRREFGWFGFMFDL